MHDKYVMKHDLGAGVLFGIVVLPATLQNIILFLRIISYPVAKMAQL